MKDLTETDIQHFREVLLLRRTELQQLELTGKAAARPVILDQSSVGRLSRMDAMQAQAMSQETNRRRELALKSIGAALQRLESGEYGYCLSCDEPIARGRLEFDPATRYCIACASRVETS